MKGKIDGDFDGRVITTSQGNKIVIHMGEVQSITSLGVQAFEKFLKSLGKRQVVLLHVSAVFASQLIMLPTLRNAMKVESAKLPFLCPSCGSTKHGSVPFKAGAERDHAPKCDCGATMELDGLPEQYLPR
jgi:hypothetical protein